MVERGGVDGATRAPSALEGTDELRIGRSVDHHTWHDVRLLRSGSSGICRGVA